MAKQKKKIRVLFYVAELPPVGGGVATSAYQILSEIGEEDGVEIDVITLSYDGSFKKYKLNEWVSVHELAGSKLKKNELQNQKVMRVFWYLIASYIYTWKVVVSKKYDLSCFFGYPGGVVGLLFFWKMPYVVSLQGLETPGYNPKFKNWYLIYKWWAKLIFGRSKAMIACSGDLAKLAKMTSKKVKVKVIPTGVDIRGVRVYSEERKYKKFTITAGGTRMGSIKRLEDLVVAFAMLSQKYNNVRLLLYGNGEKESQLKRMVKDLNLDRKVKFVGPVDREHLYKNLGKCHVMVLPSLNEGMSNAVLGAMAASLPVVMTKVGGYADLIKGNGILVEKESPKEIFNALEKIYKNKELRIKMGDKSRRIAARFDWKIITKKYVDVFWKVGYGF